MHLLLIKQKIMHKSDRRRNQSKIDEINARKDLSDKEKQVAVEQLNKLKTMRSRR